MPGAPTASRPVLLLEYPPLEVPSSLMETDAFNPAGSGSVKNSPFLAIARRRDPFPEEATGKPGLVASQQ
jgi:hypothetical protein